MHVISRKTLELFWQVHPETREILATWYKVAENCTAKQLSELRETFGAADYVPDKFTVFNVGGNNVRVICVIHYDRQKMYIRYVFTHKEYDKWTKSNRGK
jgi:mRNA interferase HigB